MKPNIEWKILIAITFVVVVLNLTGVVKGIAAMNWFNNNSTSIIMAILISLLYFIIRIYEKKQEIEHLLTTKLDQSEKNLHSAIMNSLKAPFVRVFNTEEEFKEYYIERVSQAKKCIDDLTWSHRISDKYQLKSIQAKEKKLEKEIDRVASNIIYREIFMFNVKERKEKLIHRLKENKEGYLCSYYEANTNLPRLQYVLIDGEEAIFTSNAFGTKFSISNPVVLELLQSYFDVAWENSLLLKKGYEWNFSNLRSVLGDQMQAITQSASNKARITEAGEK